MKVYLAGKITKNDWRSSLLGHRPTSLDAFDPMPSRWPEAPGPEGTTITGPWFISCDHGCFHGDDSHGVGATPNWGGHEPLICGSKGLHMEAVLQLCLQAIDAADVVFVWLDSPGAYGTVFEIGYAVAKGKRVYAAGSRLHHERCDEWLAFYACSTLYSQTVQEAFSEMVSREKTSK